MKGIIDMTQWYRQGSDPIGKIRLKNYANGCTPPRIVTRVLATDIKPTDMICMWGYDNPAFVREIDEINHPSGTRYRIKCYVFNLDAQRIDDIVYLAGFDTLVWVAR